MNRATKIGFGALLCLSVAMPGAAQDEEAHGVPVMEGGATKPARTEQKPAESSQTPGLPKSAASQDGGAHGIPVLEGGPGRTAVKPARPGNAPAGGIEVAPSARPALKTDVKVKFSFGDLYARTAKIDGGGGWVTPDNVANGPDIVITQPQSVEFRWSSKPQNFSEVMWVISDGNIDNVLQKGYTKSTTFSIDFKPPLLPPAPEWKSKKYLVTVFRIDENRNKIPDNPYAPQAVHIEYQKAKTTKVKACNTNSQCAKGSACWKGQCLEGDHCTVDKLHLVRGSYGKPDVINMSCAPYLCKYEEYEVDQFERAYCGNACTTQKDCSAGTCVNGSCVE